MRSKVTLNDSTTQIRPPRYAISKDKAFQEGRFVVVGATEGEGARASTFGSLMLAQETEAGLRYVGNVGSGFSEALLQKLAIVLEWLQDACPLPEAPNMDRPVRFYVRPFVWCEVKHLGYGADGKLRFPSFKRLVSGC